MKTSLGLRLPKWLYSGRDYVREKVRIRDGRKCRSCGNGWNRKKKRLDVHHLNGMCGKKSRSYDRVTDMRKLITLCHSCHLKKHVSKDKFGFNKISDANIEKCHVMLWEGDSYDVVAKRFGIKSAALHFRINGRPLAKKLKNV